MMGIYVGNLRNRKMTTCQVLVLCAVLLLVAMPVVAALTGDLYGILLDPKGDAVGGAKVTTKNQATGAEREVITDVRGEFVSLQLELGAYEVRIEKSGFR